MVARRATINPAKGGTPVPPLPTCPTKWGEPNRCSVALTLTLAKIEYLCYSCKRSQKESARQPNRLLA